MNRFLDRIQIYFEENCHNPKLGEEFCRILDKIVPQHLQKKISDEVDPPELLTSKWKELPLDLFLNISDWLGFPYFNYLKVICRRWSHYFRSHPTYLPTKISLKNRDFNEKHHNNIKYPDVITLHIDYDILDDELLSLFPNISNLYIDDGNMLMQLQSVPSTIKHLNVSDNFTNHNEWTINELPSLISFNYNCHEVDEDPKYILQRMPNLKTLRLSTNKSPTFWPERLRILIMKSSLQYHKIEIMPPSLIELHIVSDDDDDFFTLPMPNVQKLVLMSLNESKSYPPQFWTLFPNLTSLTIGNYIEMDIDFIKELPLLKELSVALIGPLKHPNFVLPSNIRRLKVIATGTNSYLKKSTISKIAAILPPTGLDYLELRPFIPLPNILLIKVPISLLKLEFNGVNILLPSKKSALLPTEWNQWYYLVDKLIIQCDNFLPRAESIWNSFKEGSPKRVEIMANWDIDILYESWKNICPKNCPINIDFYGFIKNNKTYYFK